MTLKQVGKWWYFYDGSSGSFYALTTKDKMEEFLETDEGEGPAPFSMIIPISSKSFHYYSPGEEHPDLTVNIDDVNAEEGTEFKDIDDYIAEWEP